MDNGKENGNYCIVIGYILGIYIYVYILGQWKVKWKLLFRV